MFKLFPILFPIRENLPPNLNKDFIEPPCTGEITFMRMAQLVSKDIIMLCQSRVQLKTVKHLTTWILKSTKYQFNKHLAT